MATVHSIVSLETVSCCDAPHEQSVLDVSQSLHMPRHSLHTRAVLQLVPAFAGLAYSRATRTSMSTLCSPCNANCHGVSVFLRPFRQRFHPQHRCQLDRLICFDQSS